MDRPLSPAFWMLLGALLIAGGFLAAIGLGRLAAAPAATACTADCAAPAPRPLLDPDKAQRFAKVFRD